MPTNIDDIAREISKVMIEVARDAPLNEPVQFVTGNRYVPPLRSYGVAEIVWQADETGEDFALLAETIESLLDDASVVLECPDYDNALYVVDIARFEYDENSSGDSLNDDWRPIDASAGYAIDDFVGGYLDGILFTESPSTTMGHYSDEEDDTSLLSYGLTRDHFTDDARAEIREECVAFISANRADLDTYSELRGDPVSCPPDSFGRSSYSTAECAGSDFWLSRNGHGAGYFDRGTEPVFARLQDAAKVYGSTSVQFDGEMIST